MRQSDNSSRSRAASWVPEVAGILTAEQIIDSGHAIAAVQAPDGSIGWPDGHVDGWNHVECAMALSVCGLRDASRRAYEWLRTNQRDDGSWYMKMPPGEVNLTTESNHAAYCAVGVWHELLVSRDEGFVQRMWPTVKAAMDFVLGLQTPRGEIIWRRDEDGTPGQYALLTGSASMYTSLRCAIHAGRVPGRAPARLGTRRRSARPRGGQPPGGVRRQEPVLDGLVLPGAGRAGARAGRLRPAGRGLGHLRGAELGVRCVSDEPWVTAAETAELAITLEAIGDPARALDLLDQIQMLRDPGGAYWTGWQYVNRSTTRTSRAAIPPPR